MTSLFFQFCGIQLNIQQRSEMVMTYFVLVLRKQVVLEQKDFISENVN